jgi:hypothetical protein
VAVTEVLELIARIENHRGLVKPRVVDRGMHRMDNHQIPVALGGTWLGGQYAPSGAHSVDKDIGVGH